jgi:carbon storage regulator
MLVLGRKVHETITISDKIRITVLRICGNRVRLGVEAPANVNVVREELLGPGVAGPEAGGPPIPRAPDGSGTDGEPLPGRSRDEPRRGEDLGSSRSSGARPCEWSRKDPRRQGSRVPRGRNP